jgi:putative ABC transport system substrate-binding protein
MRRRDFIKCAGSVVAWPLVAHAQQAALPLIGFVNSAARQTYEPQLAAFLKGLGEAGYFVGGNVAIE